MQREKYSTKGLTTRNSSCDKSKVVTEDQIEQALEVLDNAKQQYTWKSLDEPFFK